MAVPVARVYLKVAHAALPALLPTPPNWTMLPLLPTSCPFLAATHPKPLAMSSRADTDERWDAHKTKSASTGSSTSSSPRSSSRCDGRGPSRNNATSPPPKTDRADSAGRWDAHKKAASPASPSSPSSGASAVSRASSTERWDVRKRRSQSQAKPLDDGENSRSTGSNDIDDTEEILWKPRALYAGPGFVVAAPEPTMIPMPAGFLVPVA